MHAGNPAMLDAGATPKRCNTGLLIDGRPGDDGDGWDQFILCRSGDLDSPLSGEVRRRFYVDREGNVWAMGTVTAGGNISNNTAGGLDITGTILSHADIAAFNTVQAGGEMYATNFVVTSSQALKENIVPLDEVEAAGLLAQLTPVRYNLKAKPDRQLMGFVLENVPAAFAVDAKGVDVMAVVATLARIVQSQQAALNVLKARVDTLSNGAQRREKPFGLLQCREGRGRGARTTRPSGRRFAHGDDR